MHTKKIHFLLRNLRGRLNIFVTIQNPLEILTVHKWFLLEAGLSHEGKLTT